MKKEKLCDPRVVPVLRVFFSLKNVHMIWYDLNMNVVRKKSLALILIPCMYVTEGTIQCWNRNADYQYITSHIFSAISRSQQPQIDHHHVAVA